MGLLCHLMLFLSILMCFTVFGISSLSVKVTLRHVLEYSTEELTQQEVVDTRGFNLRRRRRQTSNDDDECDNDDHFYDKLQHLPRDAIDSLNDVTMTDLVITNNSVSEHQQNSNGIGGFKQDVSSAGKQLVTLHLRLAECITPKTDTSSGSGSQGDGHFSEVVSQRRRRRRVRGLTKSSLERLRRSKRSLFDDVSKDDVIRDSRMLAEDSYDDMDEEEDGDKRSVWNELGVVADRFRKQLSFDSVDAASDDEQPLVVNRRSDDLTKLNQANVFHRAKKGKTVERASSVEIFFADWGLFILVPVWLTLWLCNLLVCVNLWWRGGVLKPFQAFGRKIASRYVAGAKLTSTGNIQFGNISEDEKDAANDIKDNMHNVWQQYHYKPS